MRPSRTLLLLCTASLSATTLSAMDLRCWKDWKCLIDDHLSLFGEFVYMRRSDIHKHRLVEDSHKPQCQNQCPDFTVIDTKNLINNTHFEPGLRVGMLYTFCAMNAFEVNFLYLWPWHADKSAHGDRSLSFPFNRRDYDRDFTRASKAHAKYEGHFWDFEANYWRYFNPRRVDFFSLSGIAGLRYFHLDEEFKLSMTRPPQTSSYKIRTQNRMYGAQLGLDFQMNPLCWLSWEIFAKAGIFGNDTVQKQFLGDRNNRVTLRHSRRHEWQFGGFTDVAAQVGLQFFKCWNVHAGYQAMWFSGLAIAPEQVSKGTGKNAGKRDQTNGNAIIHGLYAGLTWNF